MKVDSNAQHQLSTHSTRDAHSTHSKWEPYDTRGKQRATRTPRQREQAGSRKEAYVSGSGRVSHAPGTSADEGHGSVATAARVATAANAQARVVTANIVLG